MTRCRVCKRQSLRDPCGDCRRDVREGSLVDPWANLASAIEQDKARRPPITMLHACGECGGLSIQFEWWLDVNRDRLMGSCQSDAYWCPRCEDHHRWCLTLTRVGESQLWRCDDEQGAEGQLRHVLRALCPDRPRYPAGSKRGTP